MFGKWFEIENGYALGAATSWENNPMWDKIDDALKPFRTSPRGTRMLGHAGPPTGQGHRGLHQVRHHRHVRQGRPGHAAGGRGKVGRERAEEDLRSVVVSEEPA
jgi:hypothetical protein